jgi:uncharacterized membrane protein YqgA involved in biofilm formation
MWYGKVYTTNSVSNKIQKSFNKRIKRIIDDMMGIIILFLGILFLNSCFHGLQKLNCCNHVFLNYLQ